MKAAFFDGPGRVVVREVSIPACPEGGLLTRVRLCAICGSDLRTLVYGPSDGSRIYGHESVLEVVEVGKGVRGFGVGDRVMLCPVTCGRCEMCRSSAHHLCLRKEQVRTSTQGGFAELVLIGAEALSGDFVIKIPDRLDDAGATVIEPLACVLNGNEKISTGPGKTVAIIGAGTVGNLHLQVAKLRGARAVIMVDLLAQRLAANTLFGPDVLVDASSSDPVGRVSEATGGGASVVIVACVSGKAQAQALQMAARQGEVLFFAALPGNSPGVPLNTNLIHYKELKVMGARSASRRHFDLALDLVMQGRVSVAPLITHILPLAEIAQGFELMRSGAAMRVALKP
ncbi:MAG: alcohol dehydrogenase catalytic domain-containing protein [Bacillota bacterium]|nr:alcohol dehydrogenase catalytic domain-containing protein [Bacillota bacterium]